MTRINLVDPSVLTDKHLLAEYRELPRIFTAVHKLDQKGQTNITIPDSYVLGTGHTKFFYDKLHWLWKRWTSLRGECVNNRRWGLDSELYLHYRDLVHVKIHERWYNDWTPKPEDVYLNMARLARRSKIDKVLEELNGDND